MMMMLVSFIHAVYADLLHTSRQTYSCKNDYNKGTGRKKDIIITIIIMIIIIIVHMVHIEVQNQHHIKY